MTAPLSGYTPVVVSSLIAVVRQPPRRKPTSAAIWPAWPEVHLELGRLEVSPELDPGEEAVTLTVVAGHGTGFDFTEWTLRDGPGGEVERGDVEEYRFPAG